MLITRVMIKKSLEAPKLFLMRKKFFKTIFKIYSARTVPPNYLHFLKNAQKWPKMAKKDQNGHLWPKMAKMVIFGQKWPKMAKSGQNGHFLPKMAENG